MSPRPKIVDGIAFHVAGDGWITEDYRCRIWRHAGTWYAEVDRESLKRRKLGSSSFVPRTFKTLDNAMRAAVKACYPRKPLTVAGFALVTPAGIDVNTVCANREQAAGHLRVRYAGKGARIHPVTVIVERT